MSLRAAAGAQILYPESFFESTIPRRNTPQFPLGSCPGMTEEEGSLDLPGCAGVLSTPQRADPLTPWGARGTRRHAEWAE